jgi:hypothetical protein
MTQKIEDRRKHPRITVSAADLRVAAATQFHVESILDFSLGGARLEITDPKAELRVGLLVDVRLEWQGNSAVLNGTLRHVERVTTPEGVPDRYTAGLEFDDPDLVEKLLGPWYDDEVTKL